MCIRDSRRTTDEITGGGSQQRVIDPLLDPATSRIVDPRHRRPRTINTPSEEKATLLQAVEMLNKKSDAIKESGRIVGTDKIVVMAALNVVHDLLKTTLNDDLAIGEFERKITDMNNACQKALARLEQN